MDTWRRASPPMWPPNPRAPWYNDSEPPQTAYVGGTVPVHPTRPASLETQQSTMTDGSSNAGTENAGLGGPNTSPSTSTLPQQSMTPEGYSTDDDQSHQLLEPPLADESSSSAVLSPSTSPLPQQPMETDCSSTDAQSHQPSELALQTGCAAFTVSSLSTSPTAADKRWLGMHGLGGPRPSFPAHEQAASLLKYRIIKTLQRLSLRAAYLRLWHIMPPLDREDPGTGDGEFLRLRSEIAARKPNSKQCGSQNKTPYHSDKNIPSMDVSGEDVPKGRASLRLLLMSPHSDDDEGVDGNGNGDDPCLVNNGDVPMGPTTMELLQTMMPNHSNNEDGDNGGKYVSVPSNTTLPVENVNRYLPQTTGPIQLDYEHVGGNSDDPSFHSSRDISMGPTTPRSVQTMSPKQSVQEGSGDRDCNNASLPRGRDLPMWPPTTLSPMQAMSSPHSNQESGRRREGDTASHRGGIDILTGLTTLPTMQAMPPRQYGQGGGGVASSDNFPQNSVEVPRSVSTKPNGCQLHLSDEVPWICTGPSRPSGAFMPLLSSSSPGDWTSTSRAELHGENHTDPMSGRIAGLLVDRRKTFRDMLDWLQEDYELLCDMLYYTEEEWAKVDFITKLHENQIGPKSANQADDKEDEEIADLQLRVGTDLVLAAIQKLKESHSGRKVLLSMAQRFAQNEEEQYALESTKQSKTMTGEEIAVLQTELESVKDQLAAAMQKLQEPEYEARTLQSMMQRLVLTEEEMEEVVLKRCWLARYWGLAVQYDLFPEVATLKYERWSEVAPLPHEVVIAIGERIKKDFEKRGNGGLMERSRMERDLGNLMGKLNIESMLSVEKELRELTALKVEEAVLLEMNNRRRRSRNLVKRSSSGPTSLDALRKRLNVLSSVQSNLLSKPSEEEANDIRFKRAWLTYFWGRAVTHNVEDDTAKDRLQYWISRIGRTPTLQEAVDVARDMAELRMLEIELKLWEASRRDVGSPSL